MDRGASGQLRQVCLQGYWLYGGDDMVWSGSDGMEMEQLTARFRVWQMRYTMGAKVPREGSRALAMLGSRVRRWLREDRVGFVVLGIYREEGAKEK